MNCPVSRRTLLLGVASIASMSSFPSFAKNVSQPPNIKCLLPLEPRPIKKRIKHYFAFDTGIYHGNKLQNIKWVMGNIVRDQHNPLFIDGINETPQKRWEARVDNGYPNVILDNKGIYHCYYTLFVIDPSSTNTPKSQRKDKAYSTAGRRTGLAYARSYDGIHWEKPILNLVEFNGSKANNLLMLDVAGTGIFYEPEEKDKNKQFKLITRKEDNKKLAVAFSADGIHFTELLEWRENSPHLGADCHNSVFKDQRTNQYILTSRLWSNNMRVVALSRSNDFIHWSPLQEILRGQGFEEKIYSMPVFEYEDIYFGLASVYQQGDNSAEDFDTLNLELYWSINLINWNKAVPRNNIFLPAGEGRNKFIDGEFDSAVIFASNLTAGENCLYYMGGKGWHRSWRETGLGLAYIDKNRLAGITARDRYQPFSFTTQAFNFFDEELYIWLEMTSESKISIYLNSTEYKTIPATVIDLGNGKFKVHWDNLSLVILTKNTAISLTVVANNLTFYGISGTFEMDESRYWKG